MTQFIDMKISVVWIITCAATIAATIFWTGFQIAIFTSTIDQLRHQVVSMQTDISAWDSQVTPLSTAIARVSASVDTENVRITNLEANVRQLQNNEIVQRGQK